MSMYDSTPSGQFDDFEFHGRGAVVRFVEFRRDSMSGLIMVKDRPAYGVQRLGDGYVDIYNNNAPVPEGEALEPNVYWEFEILEPAGEFAGKVLPYSSTLKGIMPFREGNEWRFKLPGIGIPDPTYRVGLFRVAALAGFQIAKLDSRTPGYSAEEDGTPNYIAAEVRALKAAAYDPLLAVHVLEYIVEAKLKQAAANGLLLSVMTSERSNWISYASIAAISSQEAEEVMARQRMGDAEAEVLRSALRQWAGQQPEPREAAAMIFGHLISKQPGIDPSQNVLGQAGLVALQAAHDAVCGEPAPATGEVAL